MTDTPTEQPTKLCADEVLDVLKKHNCELFLYCIWDQGKVIPQLKIVEKPKTESSTTE